MFKKIIISLLLTVSTSIFAAEWTPTKPIEIVVPYPAGGATDQIGRIVGEIFTKHGWENVIVNKPGASTTIGTNYVAEAKPDGHTLYIVSPGALDANLIYGDDSLGIKYTKDSFTDISPLTNGAFVLVASKDAPYNNYDEFKQYVKQNPDKFNMGFWNLYISNVLYEWASKEGLSKPNVVMYKGSAPQIQDLLGGHLNLALDAYTTIAPHYAAGNIKILAVFDHNGYKMIKSNFPGARISNISNLHQNINVPIFIGLQGPAGMNKNTVNQINRLINKELSKPEYADKLKNLYIQHHPGKPEDLHKIHRGMYVMFKSIKEKQ